MRKLVNFNVSSGKSENLHFIVMLLSIEYKVSAKRPYIKYVGGRGPEGFCGDQGIF